MELSDIPDYYLIGEDIYTGGQPGAEQISLLAGEKFEIIINLSSAHFPQAIPDEQNLVMTQGMAYVHIPVEWANPTSADLRKFFHFFSIYPNFKTFTHCARNMRVSSFVFLYRILAERSDPEACLQDLLTIWTPNETWQQFIDASLVHPPVGDFRPGWNVNWQHLPIATQRSR